MCNFRWLIGKVNSPGYSKEIKTIYHKLEEARNDTLGLQIKHWVQLQHHTNSSSRFKFTHKSPLIIACTKSIYIYVLDKQGCTSQK